MKTVKQISVFLENKPGQLAEFTKVMSDANIDMRSLCLAEAAEFGIVRVIVNNSEKAVAALKDAGYICAITSVIAAIVPDKPGGLCGVLELLGEAGINIEYNYVFTGKKKDGAYNVFHTSPEDAQKTIEILESNGVELVTQEALEQL